MVYFDAASTTKIHPEVLEAMMPYLTDRYGNPSSSYEFGRLVKRNIESVRAMIAGTINASPDEIFFTSGGTESDNWAIKGVFDCAAIGDRYERPHIISQPTEHKAVLKTLEYLKTYRDADIDYVPVNSDGQISLDYLEHKIQRDTCLISIMAVNNEIGTIQNISRIGEICRNYDIPFHSDAVQAYGHIPIDVFHMGIGLLSASGHKFGAPCGIGFLYCAEKFQSNLEAFIHGGQQESGHRAGTENAAAIIGMGKAAEIAMRDMNDNLKKLHELYQYFLGRLNAEFPKLKYNGIYSPKHVDSNLNINMINYGITGEQMLAFLEEFDICVSSGSACNSESAEPSYVLRAIGCTDDEANSSIRFSLSPENTKEDIDFVIKKMAQLFEMFVE